MKKIRILLANHPRLLRELVREIIERQPDMTIVGELLDPLGLLLAAKDTEADAVIIALRNSEAPGLVSHLLAECPNVTVLGLVSQGNTAFIVQMRPWRREIVDSSEFNILNALPHAVREPCSSEDEVDKWHPQ
jgi:DNA-binding NarL/FixJ family response regulator